MDDLLGVKKEIAEKRATACGAKLVGVNNRDLCTFEVSLETSLELSAAAHPDAVLVSESGLQSAADLRQLRDVGYRGFLIGELLMRAERPDEALKSLMG